MEVPGQRLEYLAQGAGASDHVQQAAQRLRALVETELQSEQRVVRALRAQLQQCDELGTGDQAVHGVAGESDFSQDGLWFESLADGELIESQQGDATDKRSHFDAQVMDTARCKAAAAVEGEGSVPPRVVVRRRYYISRRRLPGPSRIKRELVIFWRDLSSACVRQCPDFSPPIIKSTHAGGSRCVASCSFVSPSPWS
ncbi:hypothetical protein ppKF707_0984 [Metapseudomonas furukawaii]|nr:hypothetical protein ppKF707_0984 [Pseudomonas furukawaii]